MHRKSQQGVALVITLIMLAIITVITVMFLQISRRNRAGTSLQSEQTTAEFATEAGLQRAKADMIAQILHRRNLLGFNLTVSLNQHTNLIAGLNDPEVIVDGRVPVFVDTNRPGRAQGPLDFRFFLDLNRNGEFEPTRMITNEFPLLMMTNISVVPGDPHWVGILDKPHQPHGRTNRFIARYAYIVLPAGLALDVNANHNNVKFGNALPGTGFGRNQGVGAFEINLAALLHELNPMIWDYNYGPLQSPVSSGQAFQNALDLVSFRQFTNGVAGLPPSALQLFGQPAGMLQSDGIDNLADDDLAACFALNMDLPPDRINVPFPGAEAAQHYFTAQELFDPEKTSPAFVANLRQAINNQSDPEAPYGYYQLLEQLGTDSGGEPAGSRIHLNWKNQDGAVPGDFIDWHSSPSNMVSFFTNAAQRIFLTQSNDFNPSTNAYPIRSIFEIPVYPTNQYIGPLHRILQQAANILDATSTNQFPSVFRPVFRTSGDIVFISDFVYDPTNSSALRVWLRDNTNGIPVVVGAKRGFPNFNEYTMRADVMVTRKLQLKRPDPLSYPNQTNQMYVLGVSNVFGVEAWNSYSTPYTRPSVIQVSNHVTVVIAEPGQVPALSRTYSVAYQTNIISWPGRELILPLYTNIVVLSNSVYWPSAGFVSVTNIFQDPSGFDLPYWIVTVSNQMTYLHYDSATGRLIDCVVLKDTETIDLHRELIGNNPLYGTSVASVWDTNRVGATTTGPTRGIANQIDIALNNTQVPPADWTSYGLAAVGRDRERAIDGFRQFFRQSPHFSTSVATNSALAIEAPFNPVARLNYIKTWQANDPLVHYHRDDLRPYPSNTLSEIIKPWRNTVTNPPPSSLGRINDRYSPWGGNPAKSTDPNAFSHSLRDPGVYSSDDWEFPTNKLASVGWLGRVHRGTPWQTIYLKADAAPWRDWRQQYGDVRNHPTNDWKIAEIFTTALTEAMTKGLLSVNQTNVGAWSAALSGVVVVSNSLPTERLVPLIVQSLPVDARYVCDLISPAGLENTTTNPALMRIWAAVQNERIRVGGFFTNVAQVLAVPELTTESPFLNRDTPEQRQHGIDDFAYERIPQQILGLLRVGEARFVIYAYGQALKPAHINPSTGIVENYAVTSEFATRTVLRVEGTAQRPRTVVESFNILPPE